MQIIKVGISYHHAPIDVRERAAFSEDGTAQAMNQLNRLDIIMENVIFSTCNRTEIYAVTEDAETGIQAVRQFLLDWFQMEHKEDMHYVSSSSGRDAIAHLFKLATGLDSMVVGETQILGQVKDAFAHAQTIKTTGKMLNELFKRVITFAKRSHRNTAIGKQAVSISYVAVELAKSVFDNMANKQALIIGAGETGELSLKNLQGAGVSKATVINRTFDRAKKLAEKFHADAVPYDRMEDVLLSADIVITSTASTQVILPTELLETIMEKRHGNALCLIDIAVPRDVDTSVGALTNVFLYDVDDLKHIAANNMASRKQIADVIEREITGELDAFYEWVAMQDAVPIIKALQEKSQAIQERTWDSIMRKLPDLTEHEVEVLQKHTQSIVNQLLKEPIRKAKSTTHSEYELALLQEIFELEDGIEER